MVAQEPPLHPPPHTVPQLPQFVELVFVLVSQPLAALPSQSPVPAPHVVHDPLEQVWFVVQVDVVHVVPQLESRLRIFSQPFD